jgi:phosphatidylglycerophosphatase C
MRYEFMTFTPSTPHVSARTQIHGKQRLALFDFDGTITSRDTLEAFIRFYRGSPGYVAGLIALFPVLSAYKLGILPNWKAKEKLMTWFFRGENVTTFDARCEQFAREIVPRLVRPEALREIRQHQDNNTVVCVVSASAENWVKPWCREQGIQCLATRLEEKSGILTGKFEGQNCHGDEKVHRIKTAFEIDHFSEIIAYGDSSGDRQMLELAHIKHYKPFRSSARPIQTA